MADSLKRSLTTVLHRLNAGSPGAFAELVNAVYDDLRGIAAGRMHRQFDGPIDRLTNPPTVIVHDAVMRLREQHAQWKNTDQFFAVATRLLQQIILDYKKHRLRDKRGGGNRGVGLDAAQHADRPASGVGDVDVRDLISRLHEENPQAAEVVTLHVLCYLSLPETAARMKVSLPSVESDWRFARAWFSVRLREGVNHGKRP